MQTAGKGKLCGKFAGEKGGWWWVQLQDRGKGSFQREWRSQWRGLQCLKAEMGVQQKWWDSWAPLQWKTQTSPFGIVCLYSQNSLWIQLFPKKGKISHKSNKIPRVSCFPGHEPRLHRQMLVVPEQEGVLKLGLSAVFLGAAVSCVISLCLSFTAVKTIEVAKRTPSELMFDWKVYSNSCGNTTVPLTVQLHPRKHFQFLFFSGSHGLC